MHAEKQPELSVIVPAYNVAEYLAETLRSLACQSLDSLEVIIVDDGSTDETSDIADYYADKYPAFHCFHTKNGGPGAARNYGVERSRGKYLAFCDGDDLVPPNAYLHLLKLAKKHGADFAVGGENRFDSAGYTRFPMHEKAFENIVEVPSLKTHPQLIYDTTAHNKLFERSFYLESLGFPEGVFYEDVLFNIKAYCLARTIAFLDEVVYSYRKRDGAKKSTTQSLNHQQIFHDKLHAIKETDCYLAHIQASPSLLQAWDRHLIDHDFVVFLNLFPGLDDESRRKIADAARPYLDRVDSTVFRRLKAVNRVKYQLLTEGRMDELVEFITYACDPAQYGTLTLKEDESGRLHGAFPFDGLTPASTDMTDETRKGGLYTRVDSIAATDDGFTISAEVHMFRLPSGEDDEIGVRAWLEPIGHPEKALELPTRLGIRKKVKDETREDPVRGTVRTLRRARTRLSLALKQKQLEALEDGEYRILIAYTWHGFECAPCYLKRHANKRKATPDATLIENRAVSFVYTWNDELKLCLAKMPQESIVEAAPLEDGGLALHCVDGTIHTVSPERLLLDTPERSVSLDRPFYYYDVPRFLPAAGGAVCLLGSASGQLSIEKLGTGCVVAECISKRQALQIRLHVAYSIDSAHAIKALLVCSSDETDFIDLGHPRRLEDGMLETGIAFVGKAGKAVQKGSYHLFLVDETTHQAMPAYANTLSTRVELEDVGGVRTCTCKAKQGRLLFTVGKLVRRYRSSGRYARALERRLHKLLRVAAPQAQPAHISPKEKWHILHGIPTDSPLVAYAPTCCSGGGFNLQLDFTRLIDACTIQCVFAFTLPLTCAGGFRHEQLDMRVIDLVSQQEDADNALQFADVIISDALTLTFEPQAADKPFILFRPDSTARAAAEYYEHVHIADTTGEVVEALANIAS